MHPCYFTSLLAPKRLLTRILPISESCLLLFRSAMRGDIHTP